MMMVATQLSNNVMNPELMNPESYSGSGTQTSIDEPDGPSIQYLAGFFDGEGSIYAAGSNEYIPQFFITVQTTNEIEPTFYQDRWGGYIQKHDPQNPNHSTSWRWRLSGENARISIEQMLPYLHGKKKQAKLFLEAIAYKLQQRNGTSQYPPEAREPLVEYANELRGMSADRGGQPL